MNIIRRLVIIIGVVLVVGAAVYALRSPATPTSPSSAPTVAAARVGTLSIRTVDGSTIAVPTSGRPTILYAMAAWCVSCVQGATNLAQLYQDYGSHGLQVVAIDVDPSETPSDLARFRAQAGDPKYSWAMDEGGRLTQALAIRSLDATILVSGSGQLLFRSESLPNPQTLRRAVQRALGL